MNDNINSMYLLFYPVGDLRGEGDAVVNVVRGLMPLVGSPKANRS